MEKKNISKENPNTSKVFNSINYILIIALLVIVVLTVLNTRILNPIRMNMIQDHLLGYSQASVSMEKTVSMALKYNFIVSIISGLISLLFVLVYTSVFKLILICFKTKLSFKKALLVITSFFVVISLGQLLDTLYLQIYNVDEIYSPFDLLPHGINTFFIPNDINLYLYIFLSNINIYELIGYILFIYLLKRNSSIQVGRCIFICSIFWLFRAIVETLVYLQNNIDILSNMQFV